MADINDTPGAWEGVVELTRDTLVDAGEDGQGPSNAQARSLAKRTQYLKALVEQNQQTISDHDDAIVGLQGEVDGIKNGQFWTEESADFSISINEYVITRVRVSTLANPVVGTLPVSFHSDGIGIIFTDQDDTWDTNVFKLEIPAGATYTLEGAVEEEPGVYRLTLSDKGALAYVIYDSSEDNLVVNTSATGGSTGGGGLTLSGQWDMTGVGTEAAPLEADNVSCTVQVVDSDTQRITPVAPLFDLGGYFASTAFSQPLSSLTGSAKYLHHTPDVGDNFIGVQLGLVQTGKTLTELLTELSTPTPGVYGVILQFMTGNAVVTVVQDGVSTNITPNGFSLQPTDRLYLITNEDNGTIHYQINDNPPVALLVPNLNFSTWPQMRVFYNSLFTDSTPVLANGYTTIDMGASDGGRIPYQDVSDATPPIDAADGKAYEVIGSGTYNGVRGYAGDVAVFHNSTANIFLIRHIDPATLADKNDLILLAQEMSTVSGYKGIKRIEHFVISPNFYGVEPGLLYACSPNEGIPLHQDLIDAGLTHGDLFMNNRGVYTKYTPYPGERFVFAVYPTEFVMVYLPPSTAVEYPETALFREMRTLKLARFLSNDLVYMADHYFYPEEDSLDEYSRVVKRSSLSEKYETIIDPALLRGGVIVAGSPINFRAPVFGQDLNRRLMIDMSLGFQHSIMIDIDPYFNSSVEVDPNSNCHWKRLYSSTAVTLGVSQKSKWGKFSPEGKYIVAMGIGISRMYVYRTLQFQPLLIGTFLPSASYPPIGKAIMHPFVTEDTTLWAASCGNLTGYDGLAPNGNLYRIDYTTGELITTVTDQGWGLIRDFTVDYQRNKIFIVSGNGLWEYGLWDTNVTQISTDTNFSLVTAGRYDNLLVNDYFYTSRSAAPYVERWKISDYTRVSAPGVSSPPIRLELSPDGVYLACGSHIVDAETMADTTFAVNSYGRTKRAFWLPMT